MSVHPYPRCQRRKPCQLSLVQHTVLQPRMVPVIKIIEHNQTSLYLIVMMDLQKCEQKKLAVLLHATNKVMQELSFCCNYVHMCNNKEYW